MSGPRQLPVESVGRVDIYAPPASGKKPYFRLKWVEPSGTPGDTSGGTSIEEARATQLAVRLARAASAFSVTLLPQLIEDYLAAGRSPYTGQSWQKAYKNQTKNQLLRCVRGFENYCAMDVTRELLDRMRAQAGTDQMVKQNTTALRGLLQWGSRHPSKYFTPQQAELLPERCVHPIPTMATGATMPKRKTRTRAVGQHEDYIQDSDAPDAEQVTQLSSNLSNWFPAWGQLAVEMAANLGFRWGEQFQLAVPDVHLEG